APYITAQAVVSLTKGVEAKTFSFMSDIIREELPEVLYGITDEFRVTCNYSTRRHTCHNFFSKIWS
ncbi:hypothetical protein B4N86_16125, partial [Acinetobacter baumannii]